MSQCEIVPIVLLSLVVFYPTRPGSYVPIVFVPVFIRAILYTEFYTTVLANLAGYGYIVAGMDLFWPVVDAKWKSAGLKWQHGLGAEPEPKLVFETIQWVCIYL